MITDETFPAIAGTFPGADGTFPAAGESIRRVAGIFSRADAPEARFISWMAATGRCRIGAITAIKPESNYRNPM